MLADFTAEAAARVGAEGRISPVIQLPPLLRALALRRLGIVERRSVLIALLLVRLLLVQLVSQLDKVLDDGREERIVDHVDVVRLLTHVFQTERPVRVEHVQLESVL